MSGDDNAEQSNKIISSGSLEANEPLLCKDGVSDNGQPPAERNEDHIGCESTLIQMNGEQECVTGPPEVCIASEQNEEQASVNHMPGMSENTPWKGWAELENSPDVFSIILGEWGLHGIQVEDIFEIGQLFNYSHTDLLGLVFLSRWVASDESPTCSTDQASSEPWFANQISQFSCGTVALMNIIMNAKLLKLSSELEDFYETTKCLSAKQRGIQLDEHDHFRAVHNSFSTKLDRLIVDQSMKEDMQAAKQRSQTKKRRKGRKRKRKVATADDEDIGFHFVAYIPSNGSVWKLDGLQNSPQLLSAIDKDEVWTQTASSDIFRQMSDAAASGFEFSLMAVVRAGTRSELFQSEQAARMGKTQRMREDWAPFIEHMLRLHAEKGDLAQLLGL